MWVLVIDCYQLIRVCVFCVYTYKDQTKIHTFDTILNNQG